MSLGARISRAVERCRTRVEPRSGDCGNVASALVEFFDNTELVSVSTSPHKHDSAHFCVEIDGTLYDGFGRTSAEEMVELFSEVDVNEDASEYLYEVHSVESQNYLVFPEIKNQIIRNLEEEFNQNQKA